MEAPLTGTKTIKPKRGYSPSVSNAGTDEATKSEHAQEYKMNLPPSNLLENAKKRQEKTEQKKTEAFHKFLDEPMVRLTLTDLPKTFAEAPQPDKDEKIRMLLFAAFDSGFSCGQVDVLGDMLEAVIGGMKKDLQKRD